MGTFLDSLKKNIERVLEETNYKVVNVAHTYFTKIVNNSPHTGDGPYVAGHFVANWFPAINSFDTTITGNTSDGSDSLARIDAVVKGSKAFLKKDGFVSLSNNLNYAFRVEYAAWPAGKDPESGWTWTGLRKAYHPVEVSYNAMRAILK